MKNKIIILIILFTIISCSSLKNNKTEIVIDKKMEALRLAYNFATQDSIDEKYRPCQTNYYKELSDNNKDLKNHKLVKFIQNGDYWGIDFPNISYCFDDNFKVKKNINSDELKSTYSYHYNKLDTLSVLFKDFYSKFNSANSNKIGLENFKKDLKNSQLEKQIESFFREKNNSNLKVFFEPTNNMNSKALTFIDDKNQRNISLSYFSCKENATGLDINLVFNDDNRRVITHENCHLYTNLLYNKYFSKEFEEKLKGEKYKDQYTDIDEIIVRGITAKILAIKYGIDVGEKEIAHQAKPSRIVFDVLDEYINDPKMNFETIYIKIIEKLKINFQIN